MKLLIVEDSERLRRSLQQGLTRMGFTVDVSGHGLDGLTFAQTYDNDVIVLNLMLPRLNGMSILKQLRKLGDGTAVLILSAKDHVAYRVSGLESGADDYLVKPFVFDRTDPTKLELILTNLFSNAIEYSPPDTQVSVGVIRRQDQVEIMVSNVTDCLAIGDLPLLFDRFWRKDRVRARGHHAGLGLSLVKALADLLCVRVSLDFKSDREFQVTLSGRGLHAI